MRRYLPTFGLLSLCGCASLQQLEQQTFRRPTMEFKQANLSQASLSSATIDLLYSITNPNPVGLSLSDVEYALIVEGKQIAGGAPPQGFRIPARGAAELHLPVSVHFAQIASSVETFLEKDTASYEAKGTVGIATPIGTARLPLDTTGQLEVPKLPRIEFGSPHLESVSTENVALSIPITLTNRNSYPLPIENLSGTLRVGGAPLATISTGGVGELGARRSHQLTLPLSLKFSGAAEALAHGATQIDFTGAVSSGGAAVPIRLSQRVTLQR